MKAKIGVALLASALVGAVLAPASASAQSDILLRLRSGSPLGDRFRVDSASGFVAKGVLGVGIIPFTGAGERLMWHPNKAAFRAGSIGSAGTQWDDPNTGYYTWAGGYNTIALGLASFAMGYQSTALGSYSNALGYTANADGTGAVALGYRTTADADYSVAIGQRASTNGHAGAIVFSDGSTTDSTQASANNQFTVRAAGGIRLFSNATMTTGVQVSAGGSSWAVISDRNRKNDFLSVDGEDILARLRLLPVTTWRYRDEADRSTFHIGPMAQDWHRAFGFTSDDHTINMSDFDGVNLAAIKALETRTAELQARTAEVAQLRSELNATRQRLDDLEAAVRRLQEQRH
ncbi:tail fiber domain-containing protein [Longimicrobium sp.]|uniref:tail fiber domain-containing protein n=1 Tax=Longimicrobium sp. TaxID=2029185 RepID=UPI002B8F34CB|nr:tail fiber domain-containing protein [Longimicrobium sp.]HSU12787.1 tail fiber domain-containing protein [Longimicrobium sp.]